MRRTTTRRFVRSGGLKKGGRIVNVSSMMHAQASGVYALDNLQLEKTGYDPHTAYSLSKLCLTMWSIELAAELKGVADVISCHPGVVQTKMLTKGFGNFGSDVNAAHHELRRLMGGDPGGQAGRSKCVHPNLRKTQVRSGRGQAPGAAPLPACRRPECTLFSETPSTRGPSKKFDAAAAPTRFLASRDP